MDKLTPIIGSPDKWSGIFYHPDELINKTTREVHMKILPRDVIGQWRNEYEGTNMPSGIYYVACTGICYVYYDGNSAINNYEITYSKTS